MVFILLKNIFIIVDIIRKNLDISNHGYHAMEQSFVEFEPGNGISNIE